MQYPAVEVLVALGWLAAVLAYGPTFTALRVAVFGTIMLGVAITDLKHYLIPDGFTVSGFVFVLATSLLAFAFGESALFADPWEALIGACTGAGAIAIVGWLGEATLKREAMGFGDVTLMAVVGAAVGPSRSLLVIFMGAAIGAIAFLLVVYPVMRLRRAVVVAAVTAESVAEEPEAATRGGLPNVPFGVFLAPAAIVVLVAGDRLIAWYLGRSGVGP